jgi:hypothetical protein
MKRPVKAPHNPRRWRAVRLFACSPGIDSARRPDDAAESETGVDGARAQAPSQAPERAFAAVRPGFVAPCMVEAAGRASGRLSGPQCPVGSARVEAPTGLADAANPKRAARIGRISRISRTPPGRWQAIWACSTLQAETDKGNIWPRAGACSGRASGVSRLSLRERAQTRRTCSWLL